MLRGRSVTRVFGSSLSYWRGDRCYSKFRPEEIRVAGQEKPGPLPPLADLTQPLKSSLYENVKIDIHQPSPQVKVTRLDNGLRVSTMEWNGLGAGLGIAVNAGSRHELPDQYGAAFFCEKLPFASSKKHSQRVMLEQCERRGINVSTLTTREQILVEVCGFKNDLPSILDLMGDAIVHPVYDENEFEEQRYAIGETMFGFLLQPEQWVPEACFAPAFGENSSLGRKPHKLEYIGGLTIDQVQSFQQQFFTPSRMVVGALGIDHDQLVDQAHALFGSLPADGLEVNHQADLVTPYYPPPPPVEYQGGMVVEPDDRRATQGENLPEGFDYHAAAFVGFKAPSIMANRDYYVTSLLATVLGNGSSFSSGGPGKGMYSRVYREMLGNGFVNSGTNIYQALQDVGVFGLLLTGEPSYLSSIQTLAMAGLIRLTKIEDEEFARAKNQLKSQVFSNLEETASCLDDMLRQVSYYNTRNGFDYHVKMIDSISKDELYAQLHSIFSSPLSMYLYGENPAIVPYDRCQKHFTKSTQ